jgi:16S rRNA (cytidine1402-2'-O)-methyltransferase
MTSFGKLYLIPVPLGENAMHTLPAYLHPIVRDLDTFVVEKAKTARHFLKNIQEMPPIQTLTIAELNDQTPRAEVVELLKPLLAGKNVGLMSEAGCPAVADPGAWLVEAAHQKGIEVVPLVGPSSILLAIMGSGMNGQSFTFHGYIANKQPDLERDLKRLEQNARKLNQSQIFIETPYRNKALIDNALRFLQADIRLCIAADLTLPTQYIVTKTISAWRTNPPPDLHKRATVFIIGK